jgi:hypothetical protein
MKKTSKNSSRKAGLQVENPTLDVPTMEPLYFDIQLDEEFPDVFVRLQKAKGLRWVDTAWWRKVRNV